MLLRIPWTLVVNAFLLLVWPLRWLRGRRAAPRGAWLEVRVEGPITELARPTPFWDRRPRPLALHALGRAVELAAEDQRVRGIVFRIEGIAGSSATAASLRAVLQLARAKNLRTAAYLPSGGGTRDLFVASAADQIIVGPETHLSPLGFAVQAPYLRDALEKAGIEPDVFARGKYKTAGESLVLREMSEAQREQVGELLDTAWEELVTAIADGRRVSREVAEEWIHGGPWSAEAAAKRGIVDGIAYPDGLGKKLAPKTKDGAITIPIGRYVHRRVVRFRRFLRPRVIGVIEIHGAIVSKAPPAFFEVVDEEHVTSAVDRALDDRRVAAVVVHVDSRGGSALASDRMLHALKRLAKEKPVVTYLGDVAASGGYMVAVAGRSIVAQPTTITGSIGVVAARPIVEPLLTRLGVGVSVVKRGARADMMSPTRHLDEAERGVVERQLDDTYASFLRAVSEGRARPVATIEPLAGGRVWSGRAAHERGLVDKLGGFDVALAEARGLARADLEPALIAGPHKRPTLASIAPLMQSALGLLGLGSLSDAALLMLAQPTDRVWAWSDVSEVDRG